MLKRRSYAPQSSATMYMILTSRGYERPRPRRDNPSSLYTSPAMSLCMAPKRQRTRRHLFRCAEPVLRESCPRATISRMLHSQSPSRMVPSQPLSHLDAEQQLHNPLCLIELGEKPGYATYSTPSYVSDSHVVLRLCCCLRADRAAFAAG